jgi:hypothetical protein
MEIPDLQQTFEGYNKERSERWRFLFQSPAALMHGLPFAGIGCDFAAVPGSLMPFTFIEARRHRILAPCQNCV